MRSATREFQLDEIEPIDQSKIARAILSRVVNVEFLWALTKLAVRSCYFKKLDFFYIFMRNIFTHIAVQGMSWIFFALWRMRLITKIDDNL